MSLDYLPKGEMSDAEEGDLIPRDQKLVGKRGSTFAKTTNQASGSEQGKPATSTIRHRVVDKQATALAGGNEQSDTSDRKTVNTSVTRDKGREKKDDNGVWIIKHLKQTWIIYTFLVLAVAIHQYQLHNVWSKLTTMDTTGAPVDLSPFVKVSQFETNKKEVSKTLGSIQDVIRTNKDSIDKLHETVENVRSDFDITSAELKTQTGAIPVLETQLGDLEDRLKDYRKWTAKVDELSDAALRLSNEFAETKTDFENFKKKLAQESMDLRTEVQTTRNEYDLFLRDMNENHIPRLKHAKEQLDEFNIQFEEIKGKVNEVLMPNAFNKAAVLQAFMVLAVLLIMLILYMKKQPTGPGNQNYPVGNRTADGDNPEEISQDIYRIPLNQTLQSVICVVSFDEETQRHHRIIVKQIIDTLPQNGMTVGQPKVVYSIVRTHEDIVRLPPSKLYLMFADFSERHVIIEQPGIGLGDNRRTTVQAFKRLQADFVIIYYRDLESRHLHQSSRFNRNIHCVRSQDTLIKLNREGRFFSVFDKLNDFQLNCLGAIITEVFTE